MIQRYILFLLVILSFGAPKAKAQINTDRMLAVGKNALYFEDYVLAIQYFNKVIRVKPYLSEPYFFRGLAKYYLEDYNGAEIDLNTALGKNPFLVDAYNVRGIIKSKRKEYEGAIEDYSEGLKVEPNNINLLINRGQSKSALDDFESAIEDYNTVLEKNPSMLSAYLTRGMAKIHAKDSIGALEDFTTVVERNPYMADGFATRGYLYYQMGRYEEALQDYDKVLGLKNDEAQYYMIRGSIRYQLDDLRGTMSDFEKVIELEPQNAMAYNNRGILRAQVGDLNRAVEDFSRVLAINPDDYIVLFQRAQLLVELGQYRQALNDLNIVIDKYPNFGAGYQVRSVAKQHLNDLEGARLDYMTAAKIEMDRRDKSDIAEVSGSKQDDDKDSDGKTAKATRKKSDKDIRNANKLAVLDDFNEEENDEQEFANIRGKVQNRNIFIDLEPVFGLSYFSADTIISRPKYYEKEVADFNKKKLYTEELKITNREIEAQGVRSMSIFNSINEIAEELDEKDADQELLLVRGVLYGSVANYTNSISHYDRLLTEQPDNVLALFNRAYIRHKMVEEIRAMEEEKAQMSELKLQGPLRVKDNNSDANASDKDKGLEYVIDYDLILADLNRVIELSPEFEFAYYNRAILHCLKRDFLQGVEDFTKAIELNPEFSEAFFNRGLTLIYLEKEEEGTADLSKSGELGIYKAYNVIKRYGTEKVATDSTEVKE
ncbi:tetratricopeptide repeat protein [Carboxylicivirga caseinilyticus]|uniref:tetratricopeptide repeat protein n=1 Tax=Carboxylicivirga caseinilyticus TaxID=3417572 RepID=UPI003D3411DF|nr:tetratricopeptide repeat protein [Marinilabiliaceae bacterium A049]